MGWLILILVVKVGYTYAASNELGLNVDIDNKAVFIVDCSVNEDAEQLSLYELFVEKNIIVNGEDRPFIRPCLKLDLRKKIFKIIEQSYVRWHTIEKKDYRACAEFNEHCKENNIQEVRKIWKTRECNEDNILFNADKCETLIKINNEVEALSLLEKSILESELYYNNVIRKMNQSIKCEDNYCYTKSFILYVNHLYYDFDKDNKLDLVMGVRFYYKPIVTAQDTPIGLYYPIVIAAFGNGNIFILSNCAKTIAEPLGVIDYNGDGNCDIVIECTDNAGTEWTESIAIVDGADPRKKVIGISDLYVYGDIFTIIKRR